MARQTNPIDRERYLLLKGMLEDRRREIHEKLRSLREQIPVDAPDVRDAEEQSVDDFVQEVDRLGVMRRPSTQIDLGWLGGQLPGIESKIHLFSTPRIEISSSLIRERARTGKPYQHFLTKEVGEFVANRQIYRSR